MRPRQWGHLQAGEEQDQAEAAVRPAAGDSQQSVRVRAGVPQREDLQVSLIQLYVSINGNISRTTG